MAQEVADAGRYPGAAPVSDEKSIEERAASLSYWALMRMQFLKNKMAVLGLVLISLIYIAMIPAQFTAPYLVNTRHKQHIAAPPQRLHFIDQEGKFHLRPFVYAIKRQRDPRTFRLTFAIDTKKMYPIRFFVRGEPYRFLFIKSNLHLYGVAERRGTIFLLGTDLQGRDMVSRLIYGSRITLSVGFVGVTISLILGTIMGLISGYFGGTTDNLIQRAIEVLLSFPSLPLWMTLAAAIPKEINTAVVFIMITTILALIGWGGLARVMRGMTLAINNEDFVMASKVNGGGTWWIITRHLLPANIGYLIVTATLAVPGMILGETALSFLGLGIRPPLVSLGILLQQAQDVTVLAHQPWLILPVLVVVIAVLCFNFIGDGMRDAADPLAHR